MDEDGDDPGAHIDSKPSTKRVTNESLLVPLSLCDNHRVSRPPEVSTYDGVKFLTILRQPTSSLAGLTSAD